MVPRPIPTGRTSKMKGTRRKKSGESKAQSALSSLGTNGQETKASSTPFPSEIKEQRKLLPIVERKSELLKIVAENRVVIITGETGSGKTTQIPQYLVEDGYHRRGCIGCTLPWRIAATSVATRVSGEFGCEIGEEVGYTVRFENRTSTKTVIKYMTDGVLVSTYMRDPILREYSVVIIDEAHGRTANTDLLLGMLKMAIGEREDLKLIVCSATLDDRRFSTYFAEAAVLNISRRLFPVGITYVNAKIADGKKPCMTKIIRKLVEIHRTDTAGDVLVFLPGQEDIESLCEVLPSKLSEYPTFGPKPIVLPLYGALERTQQMKVFEKTPNNRKIIVATNIAESSLTIDGIVYVIDSGLVKQRTYHPGTDVDMFELCVISKAQAEQRAGRAGRTAAGRCIRLYTEKEFNNMSKSSTPEIMHCNLASPVLKLKFRGFQDIFDFPFMDAPPRNAVAAAVYHLMLLGALEKDQSITPLGRKIAELPVEPCLGRFLFVSQQMGCLPEALTIVSLVSMQGHQRLYYNPSSEHALAREMHSAFFQSEGDHFTLLEIYKEWCDCNCSFEWCMENFLRMNGLREAKKIRQQLAFAMGDLKMLNVTRSDNDPVILQKAICAAFFYNAARKESQPPKHRVKYDYVTLADNRIANISLNSSLFESQPDWIVFHAILIGVHSLMYEVASIRREWLPEVAPEFFKKSRRRNSKQISRTGRFAALQEAAGLEVEK